VEIGGTSSTKSGKYYTELQFGGEPFYDSGFNGEPLKFQTLPRLYTYQHDVSSSSHYFDEFSKFEYDQGSILPMADSRASFDDKYISRITPFSDWNICLPPTKSNEEIKFEGKLTGFTVRLIFQIFAQLKENIWT